MMRTTVEQEARLIRLKLEGTLSGLWVEELERTWRELPSRAPVQPLLVDLSGVTFIDSEGENLLTRMFEQGAELRSPVYLMTKYIVEKILHGRNGSE